jgi:peptide/nickel transport system ATP-binding protein
VRLPGDVPSPANPPSGCYFHPRCPYAQDICKSDRPPLRDVGNEHWVACHFAEELSLKGVPRLAELPVTIADVAASASEMQSHKATTAGAAPA